MIIVRKSPLTGIVSERDLPVTQEQLDRIDNGEYIQNVLPYLSSGDREFILTGYTEQDWEAMFPSDDEDI